MVNISFYIFLVTVPDIEEGKKIAKNLVEKKLVACVNIIQKVFSVYWWKGKIEEDNENLLIIKTTEEKSDSIIQEISKTHSYDNPECVGFKIEKGSEKYLNWIKKSLI